MTQLVRAAGRDERLLQEVAELRLATAGQLTRLVFSAPGSGSQHPRIARRTIQRLVDHGLLLKVQRRIGGLGAGSSSSVLALSDRGHRVIGRPGRARHRDPSLTFMSHQLAVGEIYVRLHEACYRSELVELRVDTEPRAWRQIEDGSGSQLKPDLFVIASSADTDRLAFIEVDLGSEHRGAIHRKARLYRSHWQTGTEQQVQGVYPSVLWVADDPARQAQLRRWLERDPAAGLHQVVDSSGLIQQLTKGGTT